MKRVNTAFKTLIAIISVLNIAAMMLFDYGLPSLTGSDAGEHISTTSTAQLQESQAEGDGVGTIEAVEKEEASKETEAAETA